MSGRTSSENDAEENVTSFSVQRYEVFVNPGRPMDESKEMQADLNATTTTTASSSSSFKKKTGEGIDYSHMAMISKLPARALWKWIMVWQAAQVKEGEPDQHFMCAYSDDAKTWTKAIRMPIGKQRGAIPWAPVLRLSGETLTLFFAESSTCMKPGGGVAAIDGADIPRWAPGGDIRFATTRDGFRWSKRVELLTQSYNTGFPRLSRTRRYRSVKATIKELLFYRTGRKFRECRRNAKDVRVQMRRRLRARSFQKTTVELGSLRSLHSPIQRRG